MYTLRNLTRQNLTAWLTRPIITLLVLNTIIAVTYNFFDLPINLPWLPVSVVGTAVAFFIGFKNNQAYDRVWEARKIWGGIVNDSRSWGMRIKNFLRAKDGEDAGLLKGKKKELIYRHIAWIYAHRAQMLQPTSWEHVSASGYVASSAKRFDEQMGLGVQTEDIRLDDLTEFIAQDEVDYLKTVVNPATQLLNRQSYEIMKLKDSGVIDQFEHLQLEELLREFFILQGRNERIKKFPFLRDYSTMSRFFVYVFIALLPFSLIPEMVEKWNLGIWFSIPIATLVGILFIIMEDLGDFNENPFTGMPNALPMLSISRAIEIDLREMLEEEQIPNSIEAKNGVLM